MQFHARLRGDDRFAPAFEPELDIIVFLPSEINKEKAAARSRRIFNAAAKRDLHLAVAELPVRFWNDIAFADPFSTETVTCLRSVLMKPEHLEWVESIWERLLQAHSDTES